MFLINAVRKRPAFKFETRLDLHQVTPHLLFFFFLFLTMSLLILNSHELHDFYISLHNQSRAYKYKVNKINFKRQKKGMGPCERQAVEMDNFQNPQVNIR